MGIESILEHILNEGLQQRNALIAEANKRAEQIVTAGKQSAEDLFRSILAEEHKQNEMLRQRKLIEIRLEGRRNLLKAKQEIIDQLFIKLKANLKKGQIMKQQISFSEVNETEENNEFYLAKIRQDYETEIASILFS